MVVLLRSSVDKVDRVAGQRCYQCLLECFRMLAA